MTSLGNECWEYELLERGPKKASGRAVLHLSGTEQAGHCFYSAPIETDFGAGLFDLHLLLEDPKGIDLSSRKPDDGGRLIFGDASVFHQSDYLPGVCGLALGAYAQTQDGSFCIGVRLLEKSIRTNVCIYYWAEKLGEDAPEPQKPAAGFELLPFCIKNMPKNLKCGGSFQFECQSEGGPVLWEVLDENGGSIDEKGLYTAPAEPGFYRVRAYYGEDESIVYVMVSEKK